MSKLDVFKGSTVLVTGHTGFKGSWLTLWLAELGANVIGVSNNVPSHPSHFVASGLEGRCEDIRFDIRDGHSLINLVQKTQPDFVFHLAAQALVKRSYIDPVEAWSTNTVGTINLLEALRSTRNPCVAIFITSDKCYENMEWEWGYRETDSLGGGDPYSASKGGAELAIRSYVQSYFPFEGMVRIGIGRAGNVIGGGDWAIDRIIPDCVRAWSTGEVVSLRSPDATRPWQHVLEPLSGYLNLAMALKESCSLHGQPFNFGPLAQQNHSVGELVAAMTKYWDKVQWLDGSTQYSGPNESGLLKLNCDKALHFLRWQPTWDFEDTVSETVSWYREYYDSPDKSIADFSLKQIKKYGLSAQLKGLEWSQ